MYVVGGSDYIYPPSARRGDPETVGGQVGIDIVGDRYTPLGETRFESIVDDIREQQPSVVICNLVGADSTTAFYTQFHLAGFTSESTPIAATVTTELDLAHMPAEVSDGHYMVATYFSDLASPPVNSSYRRELLEARGQRWSHSAQVGGAFNAVHALALAAEQSRSLDVDDLARALIGVRFDSNPEGSPFYFRANHYSAHPSYVGRAKGGRYEVINEFTARLPDPWWSGNALPPVPRSPRRRIAPGSSRFDPPSTRGFDR